MKVMKKFGAVFLALAMCFSLACVAFAADEGTYTITVTNSVSGVTYNAYKVFDVKTSEDGSSVSYYIDSSSDWYGLVNDTNSPFTLTKVGDEDSTTYQVTWSDDTKVTSFLEGLTIGSLPVGLEADATEKGNGKSIALDVSETGAGYYFVTSTLGTAVSLTTAAPTAEIIEKNNQPGVGGSDPKDDEWPGGFTKDADGNSYSVGDEVEYTIKSYVPTYAGSEEIDHYTITDTMGHGLTYDNDMKVTIIGTGLEDYEDITDFCTIVTSTDAEGNTVLTVTWSPAAIEEEADYTYPADAVVTITYTDTVNEGADELDLHNDVALAWFRADGTQIEPEDPENPPTADEDIYTYGFTLTKTDGSEKQLEGAQFTLAGTDGTPIQFVEIVDEISEAVVGYEVYDAEEHTSGDVEPTTTITVGSAYIWGLGEGTYILTETVAPDGYNLLSEPVTIVIASTDGGWTVTVNEQTTSNGVFGSTEDHGVADMASVSIVNESGSSLPSTGGMGTTIFYIIGGVLVAGAVVVLITRRRMSSES